jgi:hypothetical protein
VPKRPEVWIVLGTTAVLAGAAMLGTASAPRGLSSDPRLSTRLASPSGARAFRTLLERFGVNVGERLRPFFDLDKTRADPRVLLMVAHPWGALTLPEVRAARSWVARGGRLLLAGRTGIERCFGYVTRTIEFAPLPPWQSGVVFRSGDVLPDPKPRAVLEHEERADDEALVVDTRDRCERLKPTERSALWVRNADTIAMRLRFASGGEAIVVADGSVFSNRSLRTTDAGVMVVGWVLSEAPRTVLVDEYHQGFGRSSSLSGAVISWAADAPAGWMAFQLIAAGLLALGLAAVRFGPAVPAIERRRRSPLEHLDALAAGLERSGAGVTASRLIAGGLRRRLGGSARGGDTAAWLESLESGAQTPAARAVAHRLRSNVRQGASSADVKAAANAEEDLWQILKAPAHKPS